jgi:uncharacterized protein
MSKINNIVIDTNVFVSAYVFKSKRLEDIIDLCIANQQLCFCQELVDEVLRIFTIRFNQKQKVVDYFLGIVRRSNFYTLTEIYHLEADPKDGYLLSLSQLAKADYLITGDKKHLLPLKTFGKTKIVTPAEFYDIIS